MGTQEPTWKSEDELRKNHSVEINAYKSLCNRSLEYKPKLIQKKSEDSSDEEKKKDNKKKDHKQKKEKKVDHKKKREREEELVAAHEPTDERLNNSKIGKRVKVWFQCNNSENGYTTIGEVIEEEGDNCTIQWDSRKYPEKGIMLEEKNRTSDKNNNERWNYVENM